ncbi:MAG: YecA family protein [Gammaproteobacteria bacterium]|nr:MAG: YecA family protein [Gammaproteobacteria bacterium]
MSINSDSPDSLYQQLADQLVSQGALVSPAETHGVVLGMTSVKPQELQADEVLATIIQLNEEEETSDQESFLQFLAAMVEQAREMLFSQGFDVQLLLPQDGNSLRDQTLALSRWCRGYIFGLVAAGLRDFKQLPKDAAEIIQDVLQISEINTDLDEQGDEEEKAFFEIEQFVRVGVQLVFEELNPPVAPTDGEE